MADEKHLYVVAGGGYTSAGPTEESWQVGLRFFAAPGGAPDPVGTLDNTWDVVADTIARTETNWRIDGNWRVEGGLNDLQVDDWLNDQLAPAFTAWLGQIYISAAVRLDYLKVYPIGAPTGVVIPAPPYASGSPITLTWTSSNPVGGQSGALLPLQDSVVCSHRTGQVGRKGRGRMYLPPGAVGLMSTAGSGQGRITSGARAGIGAAQVTLLEDCQISTATEGFGCYPAIIGSPWDKYALITSVQVGDVIDTQRRRRNAITESVATSAVTYH